MREKISIVLAPIAALILSVGPGVARATTAQAPPGTALATGATLVAAGEGPRLQLEIGEFECKTTLIAGKVTSNQSEDVTGQMSMGLFSQCPGPAGMKLDISTNASTAQWKFQIQQPDSEHSGQIIAHILPETGSVLHFYIQVQSIGSLTTCDYTTTSLQLMGNEAGNTFTTEGTQQLVRQVGNGLICPAKATFEVGLHLTTMNANEPVTVDMT